MNRTLTTMMTTLRDFAHRVTFLVTASFVLTVSAGAQGGAPDSRIGFYGFGSYIDHRADFTALPGVGCCGPGFESGSGFGGGGGFLLQTSVARQLALQLRGGYARIGGELTRDEHIGNTLQGEEVVDAYSRHRIAPTLGILEIEPRLMYRPSASPLSISLGVAAGYVATRDYRQDETLTTPADATFTGGSRVRNESGGVMTGASPLYLAATGGVSYDIPAGSRLIVSPEISFHHQLNSVLEDSAWQAHSVRLGASVALRMPRGETQTVASNSGILSGSVSASGLHDDGAESPIVRMRVEEFMSTRLRPLLNYVFFDAGSSELPSRYRRIDRSQAPGFAIDRLHNRDVIETYHDILNIVGRRLVDDPRATVRLVGTNDGDGIEKGETALSRRRAEAVRNYLRDTWGIAESRMRIESRNLPEVPSNVADVDGPAENRRVEIIADRRSITEPVVTNDTLRIADPPRIRFRTNTVSDAGIARWSLAAVQSGRVLREVSGVGEVPAVIDWSLDGNEETMPRTSEAIDYRLDLVDAEGRSYSTPISSISVEQLTIQRKRTERIADREIDRFSLILFDFNRSELGTANRDIIEMVRRRITSRSTVQITGHTDRVGDSEHNRDLSRDRAMTVARALGVGYENARGMGESPDMFDNELPEGRFYCRIVNVTVETPVE